MTPIDIQDRLAGMIPDHTPEAVSVLVVTDDMDTAAAVGPMLAKRLYPDRYFGRVFHTEHVPGGIAVDVEAIGTPLSAIRITAGNGR